MEFLDVVNKFENPKKIGENSYQVRCCSHNDKENSLTITEENNKVLMYCHAGCDTKDILNAIGLTEKDLFNNQIKKKAEVVAEYPYTDEKAEKLYKVIRYEPKRFVQAKYENGNWIFKMENVRYVPYNLHNIINSDIVYFVEGEKDADNLNSIGLCATTTVSGASSFNKRAEIYAPHFKDKTVYIIPDNDKPGYLYADNVKRALEKVAKEVKILKLVNIVKNLPEKGDISDVLKQEGKGKTLNILQELIDNYEEEQIEDDKQECIPFEIESLSKEQLISETVFNYILSIEDRIERENIIMQLEEKAEQQKCITNFKRVLKKYLKDDNNKQTTLKHNEIAEILLTENPVAKYEDSLYQYENGVYVEDRQVIERAIIQISPESTVRFRNEVYQDLYLRAEDEKIDKDSNIINFKNGLYSIKEKKLYEHTPQFFSVNQINVNYNPNAQTIEAVDNFFDRISTNNKKRKQAMLEMIGYCMTTSVELQKSFILYGETARNGKSTLINLITELIGRKNMSNLSFKDLNQGQFATSILKGKILNAGAEMQDGYIEDVSAFKLFVTGDYLAVEEKFRQKKTLSPYAKFIFNANSLPRVSDKSNGFYRRLHIIPLETSFTEEDSKNFNFKELITKEALEYLARISVEAYSLMGEKFANYEESDKEVKKYEINSNSVLAFLNDKEIMYSLYQEKRSHNAQYVHDKYKDYCVANQFKVIGRNKFYEEVRKNNQFIISERNKQLIFTFRTM